MFYTNIYGLLDRGMVYYNFATGTFHIKNFVAHIIREKLNSMQTKTQTETMRLLRNIVVRDLLLLSHWHKYKWEFTSTRVMTNQ